VPCKLIFGPPRALIPAPGGRGGPVLGIVTARHWQSLSATVQAQTRGGEGEPEPRGEGLCQCTGLAFTVEAQSSVAYTMRTLRLRASAAPTGLMPVARVTQ
jgi:hypothetical protein